MYKRFGHILIMAAVLGTASLAAHAASFEERVRLAREAEQKWGHSGYMFGGVADQLAVHMKACIAASPNHQVKSFILVADYTKDGRAINVEVRPAVTLTKCFAEKFGKTQFPRLPPNVDRKSLPFMHEFRE